MTRCSAIGVHKLKGLMRRRAITHCVQLLHEVRYHQLSDPAPELHSLAQGSSVESIPAVSKLLQQYSHLFSEPSSLPPERYCDHHIVLVPGAQPVNTRPYRYAPHQKTEMENQLAEMLRNGTIRPSTSPYASPVLLVRKKDGSWRFCVDYRHLNNITVTNKHPLPIVDELIDELAGAQWFSKLDFRAGYHQIRIAKGDKHKTAFRTHSGLYQFLVMPFGLTNAPATFQSVMNQIFAPLLRKGVLVFMDDILVYSATLDTHLSLLQQVFEIVQKHSFLLEAFKCSFAQQQIEYLGHCISVQGVATETSKIEAVQRWPVPSSLKELRGFLGLTGYYRKFIKHYGMISRPLTMLLKKGTPFQWSPQTAEAFLLLKQALMEALVLAIPDFEKTFVLETDASDLGLGAVLMQDGHPVAYLSKSLCPKNQALSTYEECMAILMAVEKWRPYLQQKEFIIKTDHKSLLYLTNQRVHSKLQHKALLKLMDLQYKIIYKQGIHNTAVDALSRCPVAESLMAISYCSPAWQENLT